jgi:hypothetical protein
MRGRVSPGTGGEGRILIGLGRDTSKQVRVPRRARLSSLVWWNVKEEAVSSFCQNAYGGAALPPAE